MINKKVLLVSLISVLIIMSFVFLYAGDFLFYAKKTPDNSGTETAQPSRTAKPSPVKYTHLSGQMNGGSQEINILEVDVSDPDVKILPVLSSDLIYGFEMLSSMVSRKKAFAAVNGGFFTQYGLPRGMVVADGRLITGSDGKFPVFYVSEGKASLREIKSVIRLEGSTGKLDIDKMNMPADNGDTAVYTPVYGTTNRAGSENTTIIIQNGVITGMGNYPGETEIPEDGLLVTLFGPQASDTAIPFKKGDEVRLVHEPSILAGTQAYGCGSWIVRDGKVVIGTKDQWVGVLTNNDPRTAVGIKKDGKVVLMTVDGRQPGYSAGMTGKGLGEFLVGYGVVDAAMLDGGASTEMIVDGKIVNRPSFKGQERPLAGGLLVIKTK